MLFAIPTNGNAGMDESVSDHFGSAACFTLYDSDSGEIQIVKNQVENHVHGNCHPMKNLARYKIDSIICSGIGKRAIEILKKDGIVVYQSDERMVAGVVDRIKNGELTEMDPSTACRGHTHKQVSGIGPRGGGKPGSTTNRNSGLNFKGFRG